MKLFIKSLKRHENVHGFSIVRRKGTPVHVQRSKNSLTTYNSARAGYSPAGLMTLRKITPKSNQSPVYVPPQ